MSSRTTRSGHDLTADLLSDLAEREAAAEPVTVGRAKPTQLKATQLAPANSPYLETTLFLAPRSWLRPRIQLNSLGLTLSAGPVRVRAGR